MGEPHRRDRLPVAPGAPLDHEACGSLIDVEILGEFRVGVAGGDAVLRLGPGHMADQPGVRRCLREILSQRVGHRLQVDKPIFEREGLSFGLMQTAHRQHLRARIDAEAGPVARRSGALAKIDQPVGIALAALFDLTLEIGNLKDRRLHPRP